MVGQALTWWFSFDRSWHKDNPHRVGGRVLTAAGARPPTPRQPDPNLPPRRPRQRNQSKPRPAMAPLTQALSVVCVPST
jgi:hypothetical protein